MMREEGVGELTLGRIMMNSVRKSFEQVHAQASSVLLLTLKWGDLEEHYEKVERDLEERARCLEEAEKVFEERRKEMALKEEKLSSLEAQIHECGRQLDAKREEVAVEEGRLHSCSLKLKCRKLELMTVMQSVSESCTQLAAMKQQLAVIQKSIEEERSKEVDSKEVESKGKRMDAWRSAIDDQRKLWELKERQISGTDSQSESAPPVNDGRGLQILLNEHLTKHAFVHGQVSSVIKTSCYPAKLVLDAVQGSHYPLGNDVVFEPEIVRKSCVLLLDQLLLLKSPKIGPHVQNAAMQLAHEWKDKMKVGAEEQSEILRFLYLLAAFRIFSEFPVNEYGALLDRVVDKKQVSKLRHHFGMTETAKASSIHHKVKTEELGQLADSNKGVSCSSHPAAAAASGHEHSGLLNKRPRTDGYASYHI